MRKWFAKIPAFFLLIAALAPVTYLVAFHVQQWQIRTEMKSRLENMPLITIRISAEDVNWVKKDKELYFEGKMFDVKQIVHTADNNLELTGLFDISESELMDQLYNQEKQDETYTYLSNVLLLIPGYINIPAESHKYSFIRGHEFPVNDLSLSNPHRVILTPPPQV